MSSAITHHAFPTRDPGGSVLPVVLAPLWAAMTFPAGLFLITLTAMLFRPPEIDAFPYDRIAFLMVVSVVLLRVVVLRRRLATTSLTWPMVGLSVLAVASALNHPFEAKTWSLVAAKFIVPFTFFHLAGVIFHDARSQRWLERFAVVVLAYLSFTAVAFFSDAQALVFPRYILDQDLGIHADRARGPFLQAVANGVTLNLLGLLAIDRYQQGRLRGIWGLVLLASLPLAVAATKTRAVWVSFAVSAAWVLFRSKGKRCGGVCKTLVAVGMVAGIVGLALSDSGGAFGDRLHESSPVEFRVAVYRAGWSMFLDRPFSGWGTSQLQSEVAHRIDGFQGETFVVHNTYLDILVESGVLGLAFYAWIVVGLIRLGTKRGFLAREGLLGSIQRLWPLLLGLYLVNATFVVMNYQFVNGLMFTFAGMLAAAQRSADRPEGVNVCAA